MKAIQKQKLSDSVITTSVVHDVSIDGKYYIRQQIIKTETFSHHCFPFVSSKTTWLEVTKDGFTIKELNTKELKALGLENKFYEIEPKYKPKENGYVNS